MTSFLDPVIEISGCLLPNHWKPLLGMGMMIEYSEFQG